MTAAALEPVSEPVTDGEAAPIVYPTMFTIKVGEETKPLFAALTHAARADHVDRSNRIRALIHLWAMDPADEDAPPWLEEFQDLIYSIGCEYAMSRFTKAMETRGGPGKPRGPRTRSET